MTWADDEEWEGRRKPGGRPRRVFSERTLAEIEAWVSEGLSSDEIAARLGTTKLSLWISCAKYGIRLRDAKVPPKQKPLQIKLPKRVLAKLEERAGAMAATPEHLILLLLNRIVADDLFDAVLDFLPPPPSKPKIERYRPPAKLNKPRIGAAAGLAY